MTAPGYRSRDWACVIFLILAGVLAQISSGAQQSGQAGNMEDLADIMAGEYVIVGKYPDSNEPYLGHLTLRAKGAGFEITRVVGGQTTQGTASFETAGGSSKIPVLRMRFVQDGREFEGTYQWKTDLENYFRLTGYLYPLKEHTENPGLEALFPQEPLKQEED